MTEAALLLAASLGADERFVGFNRLASAAQRARERLLLHGFAETVRHKPGGLVGDAEHAVELVRRDALLAGRHQIGSEQPLAQRDMRALKHSPDRHRELAAARAAMPETFVAGGARQPMDVLNLAAVRAERAIGPADAL